MASTRFIDDAVRSMNVYRATHQAGPLRHNAELSSTAQRWADNLARKNALGHSSNSYKGEPLGENCFMKWSSDGRDVSASEVVDSWYSEVKDYNFRTNSGPDTGHFTQVVWKGSREVGVGKATTRDGKSCIVVANFYPAGNYRGRNAENVAPPASGKIVLPAASSSSSKPTSSVAADTRGGVTVTHQTDSKPGFFASLFGNKSHQSDTPTQSRPAPVNITVQSSPRSAHVTAWETPTASYGTSAWDQPTGYSGTTTTYTAQTVQGPGGVRREVRQTTVGSGSPGVAVRREIRQESAGTGAIRREVRQETVGSGQNAVVKTVTTETIVKPDGRTKTVTTEKVSTRAY